MKPAISQAERVPQAFAKHPLALGCRRADEQLVLAQDQQHGNSAAAGEGVTSESPACTDGGQEQSGQSGADQAAQLEGCGIHADGVAEICRTHQLVDEDLAGGLV
jgi:hypothetical protein